MTAVIYLIDAYFFLRWRERQPTMTQKLCRLLQHDGIQQERISKADRVQYPMNNPSQEKLSDPVPDQPGM